MFSERLEVGEGGVTLELPQPRTFTLGLLQIGMTQGS